MTKVPLVVVGKPAGLSGNPLEQVVDERVHDAHGLGRHAGVRVYLLEHLVDVDGVRLLGLLPQLAIGEKAPSALLGWSIGSRGGFLCSGNSGGSSFLWRHGARCRAVDIQRMAFERGRALFIHFAHICRPTGSAPAEPRGGTG